MLEDLQLLVRLQGIDNQLMDLELEKGDLPEQIAILTREITRYESTITTAEHSLHEIADQKKVHEQTIESARERLKKSQNTIYSVKTTREYDAISSEIEQAKHSIVDAERQFTELNTKQEHIRKDLNQALQKLETIRADFGEKQSDMKERMELSQDEELKLHHEREKTVVRLKKPVFAHYERIRKIRDGVGVSALSDGACSYCCSRVPPQRQAEIRRMDDLILCEVCGCVLVSTDENIVR